MRGIFRETEDLGEIMITDSEFQKMGWSGEMTSVGGFRAVLEAARGLVPWGI